MYVELLESIYQFFPHPDGPLTTSTQSGLDLTQCTYDVLNPLAIQHPLSKRTLIVIAGELRTNSAD